MKRALSATFLSLGIAFAAYSLRSPEAVHSDEPLAPQCTCQATESVITAVQLANAVFSGKVLDIHPYKSKRPMPKKLQATEILFEVYQSWKGAEGRKTRLIRVPNVRSECDFIFEKDKEYLVYADKTATDIYRLRYVPIGDELLDATRCSRTKLLEASQFDRRLLGPGIIPQ